MDDRLCAGVDNKLHETMKMLSLRLFWIYEDRWPSLPFIANGRAATNVGETYDPAIAQCCQ